MPEARSHLPNARPDTKATTALNTAPPAATGATTLPIQLMKLKNAPSGWVPVWPGQQRWTEVLFPKSATQ